MKNLVNLVKKKQQTNRFTQHKTKEYSKEQICYLLKQANTLKYNGPTERWTHRWRDPNVAAC